MGRWIRLEGRQANRACLLITAYCWLWSVSIPLIHHKHINHILPEDKMRRSMLFISRFNHGWSPSFPLCIQWSQWRISASVTTSLDVSVISTLFELGVVSDAFWEFCAVFLVRPSAASPACAAQTRPADALSWGCSFTAVLTEATICLAGRGCLLWVMPLQLVSAISNCHGANDSKKNYPL